METGRNKCYLIEINGFNNLSFNLHQYYSDLLKDSICFLANKCLEDNHYDFIVTYDYDYYRVQNSYRDMEKYFFNEEIRSSYNDLVHRIREIIDHEFSTFNSYTNKDRYIININSFLVNNYTYCICFNCILKDYGMNPYEI